MLKVYYRNKFRIRNTKTGQVERLNQTFDRNGRDIWTQGFDSFAEAETEMKRLIAISPKYEPYLKVESYSDREPLQFDIRKQETHKALAKLKRFSGKGLAENTGIPRKQENRYSAGKWYSREVYLAQSVEYNKGLSTIHKLKDKKSTINNGADILTYQKMNALQDGSWTEGKDMAESVKKRFDAGEFTDRKQIKSWLKERGYTVKQTRNILHRAFN